MELGLTQRQIFEIWKTAGGALPRQELRSLATSLNLDYDEALQLLAEAVLEHGSLTGSVEIASELSDDWAEESVAIFCQVASEAWQRSLHGMAENALSQAMVRLQGVLDSAGRICSAVAIARMRLSMGQGDEGVRVVENILRSAPRASSSDLVGKLDESVAISEAARFLFGAGARWKAFLVAFQVPVLAKRAALVRDLGRGFLPRGAD